MQNHFTNGAKNIIILHRKLLSMHARAKEKIMSVFFSVLQKFIIVFNIGFNRNNFYAGVLFFEVFARA